jgi:hypothetical protein
MAYRPYRVVPPDAEILADLRAGRTLNEIAARKGIKLSTLRGHAVRHNLLERARCDPAPSATIYETEKKIVCKRMGLMPGRDLSIVEILISLPRIPTLHGHFAAALPSAQGA